MASQPLYDSLFSTHDLAANLSCLFITSFTTPQQGEHVMASISNGTRDLNLLVLTIFKKPNTTVRILVGATILNPTSSDQGSYDCFLRTNIGTAQSVVRLTQGMIDITVPVHFLVFSCVFTCWRSCV